MLRNILIIFILSFLLVGCATIAPVVVDQTGRKMPDPHYTLQGTGYPIRAIFYYTAHDETTDLDGTLIDVPRYLDFMSHQDIFAENTKAITLTIEILNPQRIEYSLYQRMTIKGKRLDDVKQIGGIANVSNLPIRQFVYNLPTEKDVRDVDHYVSLLIKDQEIMRFGHFQYHLIH